MATKLNFLLGSIVGGLLLATTSMPASAFDFGVSIGGVDVNASIGNDKVGADVGVSTGGLGGLGGIGGSTGGLGGVDIGGIGIGGGGGGSDVNASVSIGGLGSVTDAVDGLGVGGLGNIGGLTGGLQNTLSGLTGTLTNTVDGLVDLDDDDDDEPGVRVVDPRRDDPDVVVRRDVDVKDKPSRTSSSRNVAVAGMSGAELTRFSRRCTDVLNNTDSYDRDLVRLCRIIRSSTR